ncbi:VOC family protein [Dinghuibacter silviterrae]|uniref:Lactoylglutathione lyase n=1 Tax=Dinghuibacter silviterrae TaxID=1539049 RepID=A0A4R8DGA0_9BACT|nr:VOC family protein [Dinghuibacter silviterrae]TDW96136.1 lactoylglutathione lyase [Dinghuibacter silviterrae]
MRFPVAIAFLFLGSGLHAQVAHINHITVYGTDLKRASDFYHDVMGFDTIPEPFHDGRHTWFRIGPHQELHVVSGAKADEPHHVDVHMAFSVSDIADFAKRLDKAGVPYGGWNATDKKPTRRPDGVLQIYFQDPDGYWIEVNNDRF